MLYLCFEIKKINDMCVFIKRFISVLWYVVILLHNKYFGIYYSILFAVLIQYELIFIKIHGNYNCNNWS